MKVALTLLALLVVSSGYSANESFAEISENQAFLLEGSGFAVTEEVIKISDIDLVNLSGADIEFKPVHVVDINVQRVLGSIADDPYENGPVVTLERNIIYDLNDDDTTNDGLGHSSQ